MSSSRELRNYVALHPTIIAQSAEWQEKRNLKKKHKEEKKYKTLLNDFFCLRKKFISESDQNKLPRKLFKSSR